MCRRALRYSRLPIEIAAEILCQSLGRVVARRRFLFQALERHRFEVNRNIRIDRPQRLGIRGQHREQQIHRPHPLVRRPADEQLVQRGAQGVDVGATVQVLGVPARLLWRHEARRSFDRARAALLRTRGLPRQPEVHHVRKKLSVVGPLYHDVAGLDVAVDQPLPVGDIERLGDLLDDPHFLEQRHLEVGGLQRLAVDQLHRDVGVS